MRRLPLPPLAAAAALAAAAPAGGEEACVRIGFEAGAPLAVQGWEEKVYNRPNRWEVGMDGGEAFLRAVSDGSASMLYRPVRFDARDCPVVRWSWKVTRLPRKGPAHTQANDDYGARIYFFFPGRTFLTSRVLQYVRDNETPPGTIRTSPSSGRCRLVVVHSGAAELGEWITVERNLFEDYARAFGRAPARPVGGIGFMTDSDDTASSAEAYYGPLTVGSDLHY
ncbi:MAG: DUF3047 domain-containing protein [bacterium]|nr:DUF3047 domain-containing protein [bacterium]